MCSLFTMGLSGNFFQEAWKHRGFKLSFPSCFSCTFSFFSSFLSLCFFLKKAQRNNKEPWTVGHCHLPLQCPPPLPAPAMRSATDGEEGGFVCPFPSLQPHELPAEAGLCFSWREQEEEGSKGWLLSFCRCSVDPKSHTRRVQSEAGQGHNPAGQRQGEELSEKQEGTSGQRRK